MPSSLLEWSPEKDKWVQVVTLEKEEYEHILAELETARGDIVDLQSGYKGLLFLFLFNMVLILVLIVVGMVN